MLSSAAVNILALGAFWISPGLRTTANRFVINLLVVNVVACIALVPALCINGGVKWPVHSGPSDNVNEFGSFASAASNNRLDVDEPQFNLHVQPLHMRYGHRSHPFDPAELEAEIIEKEIAPETVLHSIKSKILQRETGAVVRTQDADATQTVPVCHRYWGFDLAATLGEHEHLFY